MPKAYVTSIGEPTTDLCCWSLERQGFEVVLLKDSTSLANKLKQIYNLANDTFLRVDADTIITSEINTNLENWWVQLQVFDMYSFQITNGTIQLIGKQAIPYLRDNIDRYLDDERPETSVYRTEAFMNPRRCVTRKGIVGIHGFGQKDIGRVKATKDRRNQTDYDWQLAERLQEFYA